MKKLVADAGLHEHIHVESAATGDWHVGQLADPRTRATAQKRGIELTSRAQLFATEFFDRFDWVLPVDASNHATLLRLARHDGDRGKIRLLRDFDAAAPPRSDVPDPYHGGAEGFEQVFDLCEAACRGLLDELRKSLPR